MEWNNVKTIEFIKEIELYPVLWDCNHEDYKNRNKKHDATEELAKKFNCDSTEILRKWKIVLAQYRRERKKVADSKSSGAGVSDVYKPKWFGYSYLNFFHRRDEPNESISSEEIIEQLAQETEEHAENDESQGESPLKIFRTPKQGLKRRAVEEDPRIAHALSIMENVSEQMGHNKNQDEYDIYAKSVAIKVRKIKDERTKILVQKEIDNLLYDAIIGIGKFSSNPVPSPYSDSQSQGSASDSRFYGSEYSDSTRQDGRENSPMNWFEL